MMKTQKPEPTMAELEAAFPHLLGCADGRRNFATHGAYAGALSDRELTEARAALRRNPLYTLTRRPGV